MYNKLKEEMDKKFLQLTLQSPLPSQSVPNPNSKPSSSYGKTVRFIKPSSSSKPSSASHNPSSSSAHGITVRNRKELEQPSLPLSVEEDPISNSELDTPSSS